MKCNLFLLDNGKSLDSLVYRYISLYYSFTISLNHHNGSNPLKLRSFMYFSDFLLHFLSIKWSSWMNGIRVFYVLRFFRKHTFLLVRNKNTTTWYSCFIYGVESAVYHPFFFVIKVRLTFKSRTNRNWSIYTVCTLLRSKMVFGRQEQTNKWYEWNVMYNNTYDARREELTCLVALRMFLFCGVVLFAKKS